MIKKCLASYITALILLTMPLFVCINIAESDAAQVADTLSNNPVLFTYSKIYNYMVTCNASGLQTPPTKSGSDVC